jgi:hypothetical protein
MLTSNDVKARARQQPFAPFRLVTSSGEAYDVFHPDLIMVGARDVIIGTPSVGDPTQHDLVTRVAILHITAFQDLPKATKPGVDGEK